MQQYPVLTVFPERVQHLHCRTLAQPWLQPGCHMLQPCCIVKSLTLRV